MTPRTARLTTVPVRNRPHHPPALAVLSTLLLGALIVVPARAGEASVEAAAHLEPAGDPRLSLTTGIGYLQATADEIVYGGPSRDGELSHLIWDVEHAAIWHVEGRLKATPDLDLFARFATHLDADGYLVDYDWLGTGDDWTDRSLHDDTALDHYFQTDAGAAWTFHESEALSLAAQFGFRYTDISFTARGGDFVYSTDPTGGLFRDDRGSFPAGEPGISYRQQWPGLYLGPEATWARDRFSVKAGGLAGIALSPSDRDHHWDRNLLFVEDFESRGFFGAHLALTQALTDSVSLNLEALYEYWQLAKGSTRVTDTATGEVEIYSGEAAGARLESWQLRLGVSVAF